MSDVLVVLETRAGGIVPASMEALAAARKLGGSIAAVIPGTDTGAAALAAARCGADRVIRIEDPLLARYTADGFVAALDQLIRAESPAFVVFPHTYQVRDFAPALAARHGQMLVSDIVEIEEGVVLTRPILQGRMLARCRVHGNAPAFLSIQAGAYPGAESGDALAPIEMFTPQLAPEQIRARPGEPFKAAAGTVDLAAAERIVSVGRGIQGEANLALARDLAEAMDAELGASRPVCDAGWLPHERQIGSSGHTVAPRLYVAAGISGAIQHLAGIKGAQCIVAINRDPDAPIFEAADYGIAGDLLEVLPALTQAVKAARR